MEKLLLTPEEAAEVLSIGRTKIYELLGEGVLRSVRIGTCRRIPREAVQEFVGSLIDRDAYVASDFSLQRDGDSR